MGFEGSDAGYAAYLDCDRWRNGGRARFERSNVPKRCFVCRGGEYQVHHRTYKSLGREKVEHLVALCDRHHKAVHTLAETLQYPLYVAHAVEREAYIRNRLLPHREDLTKRVQGAVDRGLFGSVDGVVKLGFEFRALDEEDDFVRLRLRTDSGALLYVRARFPDGLDGGTIELRRDRDV